MTWTPQSSILWILGPGGTLAAKDTEGPELMNHLAFVSIR